MVAEMRRRVLAGLSDLVFARLPIAFLRPRDRQGSAISRMSDDVGSGCMAWCPSAYMKSEIQTAPRVGAVGLSDAHPGCRDSAALGASADPA